MATRSQDDRFPRREYKQAPIEEAVCEFRFADFDWDPTIPGRLHEAIKKTYTRKPQAVKFFQAEFSASPEATASASVRELPTRTQFSTKDERHVLSVGPQVLSVSERRPYGTWRTFKRRIKSAYTEFEEVAGQHEITRVGIRYINIVHIEMSKPVNLHQYFTCAPQDLSEISHEHLPKNLAAVLSRQEYSYADGVKLARVFANAAAPDGFLGILLDIDVYWHPSEARKQKVDVFSLVEKLRRRERVAFEASITDESRKQFGQK